MSLKENEVWAETQTELKEEITSKVCSNPECYECPKMTLQPKSETECDECGRPLVGFTEEVKKANYNWRASLTSAMLKNK